MGEKEISKSKKILLLTTVLLLGFIILLFIYAHSYKFTLYRDGKLEKGKIVVKTQNAFLYYFYMPVYKFYGHLVILENKR